MIPFSANAMEDANMMPQTMPGGDGYDPWGRGVAPPPGAPQPVYPTGETYTIPGNSGSVFMPQEGVVLVPVPVNTANTNTAPTPAKTPKGSQTNTQVSPSPKESPAETKPAPSETKPTPAKTAIRNLRTNRRIRRRFRPKENRKRKTAGLIKFRF